MKWLMLAALLPLGCHKAPPAPEMDQEAGFVTKVVQAKLDRHELVSDDENRLARKICGKTRIVDPPIAACPDVVARLPHPLDILDSKNLQTSLVHYVKEKLDVQQPVDFIEATQARERCKQLEPPVDCADVLKRLTK